MRENKFRVKVTATAEASRSSGLHYIMIVYGRLSPQWHNAIGLFANDVIIICSVRADWPAHFNVTIGNPRANKLGRNGFECVGRRS